MGLTVTFMDRKKVGEQIVKFKYGSENTMLKQNEWSSPWECCGCETSIMNLPDKVSELFICHRGRKEVGWGHRNNVDFSLPERLQQRNNSSINLSQIGRN